MTHHATGTFEVKLNPREDEGLDAGLGRMSIDKQFHELLHAGREYLNRRHNREVGF
jgi:hypothetical protein